MFINVYQCMSNKYGVTRETSNTTMNIQLEIHRFQGSGPVNWESDRSARVVSLPIVDSLRILPSYLPLSFPSSISDQLIKFHTNPPAFFIAQVIFSV